MKTLGLVFLLLVGFLAGCAGVEQKPEKNAGALPYEYLESSTMNFGYQGDSMAKAQELSYHKSIQSLYQAKLMALAGEY
jgi:hypothetical protein